jgi:periplasmic protein TonB
MSPRAHLACVVLVVACSSPRPAGDTATVRQQPDERPIMVNHDLPFHYPGALYAARKQGNVTLRLYVDSTGQTVPDSTRVEESTGPAAFDTAAIAGARDLRFIPAKLHGEPMGMTILFPVYFRHPEAPPMQGDSALRKGGRG